MQLTSQSYNKMGLMMLFSENWSRSAKLKEMKLCKKTRMFVNHRRSLIVNACSKFSTCF